MHRIAFQETCEELPLTRYFEVEGCGTGSVRVHHPTTKERTESMKLFGVPRMLPEVRIVFIKDSSSGESDRESVLTWVDPHNSAATIVGDDGLLVEILCDRLGL